MNEGNLRDYPEHLNPFKSRRSSITKSFRKVFRSFTGKDKQRPQQHVDIQQHRHTIQPVSTSQSPQNRSSYSPTPLPRSRFKERLEKTDDLKRTSKDKHWYNPFDENQETKATSAEDTPPVPSVRNKYRKRKKRTAPLPPGATSGDGQYLDVPSRNGSKWSLTSTDTDASSLCISEYEETERQAERNEEILEITRKIAEFTDDTNNNNLTFTDDPKIDSSKIEDNPKEEIELPKIIIDEDVSEPTEDEKPQEAENNSPEKKMNGCVKNIEEETVPKMDHNQNAVVRVKIIDNEEVVLRHPPQEEYEEYSIKQKIEHFESYRNSLPNSKIRQTVLTKEKLLGTE